MGLKGTHVCLTPPPSKSRGALQLPPPFRSSRPLSSTQAPRSSFANSRLPPRPPNMRSSTPTSGRVTGAESAAGEEVGTPSGGAPIGAGQWVGGGPSPRCGAARGRAKGRSRRGGAGVPGSTRAVHVASAAAVS